jgi:hypothetical protein
MSQDDSTGGAPDPQPLAQDRPPQSADHGTAPGGNPIRGNAGGGSAIYSERLTTAVAGLPMLGAGIAAIIIGVVLIALANVATIVIGVVLIVIGIVVLVGLTAVAPGQARVVQLLGRYTGSVRHTGLRWVNPFSTRRRISTRIRNHQTEVTKVNDADGNPIEIAAVVVWQVTDTAKAVFEVDDFAEFVAIQAETAVRHIANSYPYDAHGGGMSLRDSADEITEKLAIEIGARVAPAGVTIVEARLSHLAYAPEIAQAMPSWRPGSGSWRAPWAWSIWPCGGSRSSMWWSWTRSARPPWCPTCWSCCAATATRSPSSTPARSTTDGPHVAADRKNILLRLDPAVYDALARWASDDLRSTNAQIEFLLRQSLRDAGRLPRDVSEMRRPGRPRRVEGDDHDATV